jgi:hypothetical protein
MRYKVVVLCLGLLGKETVGCHGYQALEALHLHSQGIVILIPGTKQEASVAILYLDICIHLNLVWAD